MLSHWDRSCRSNFLSHPVSVCEHWANQSHCLFCVFIFFLTQRGEQAFTRSDTGSLRADLQCLSELASLYLLKLERRVSLGFTLSHLLPYIAYNSSPCMLWVSTDLLCLVNEWTLALFSESVQTHGALWRQESLSCIVNLWEQGTQNECSVLFNPFGKFGG